MKDLIDKQSTLLDLRALPVDLDAKTVQRCIEVVSNEKSVQPNLQPTCNQLATDCISRRDAVLRFSDLLMLELKGKRLPTWDEVYNAMQDVPSAQPKIIRCEYCAHRNQYRFPPKYEVRDYCEVHEKVTTLTNFCSWAER